jgi:hypothetical protein
VSSQIQSHDIVGTNRWLKLKTGARKNTDAETVTGGLELYQRKLGLALGFLHFITTAWR